MTVNEDSKRRTQGDAAHDILRAMTFAAPYLLTREQLRTSDVVSAGYEDKDLSEKEIDRKFNRTIRDLKTSGAISEVFLINGDAEEVELPNLGIASVSISLSEIKRINKKRTKNYEISQETIVDDIIEKTKSYIINDYQEMSARETLTKKKQRKIKIHPLCAYITHGSNQFDLLVFILYRDPKDYMRYVRNVIQEIDAVDSTQTMQVSDVKGFPAF